MNVEQAIARIKAATHDISDEYSNERCIEFLNTATVVYDGCADTAELVVSHFQQTCQTAQLSVVLHWYFYF